MAQIEVSVFRSGRLIKSILRPKRIENGAAAVVYKKRLYAVAPGGRIDLDEPPLRDLHEANGRSAVNDVRGRPPTAEAATTSERVRKSNGTSAAAGAAEAAGLALHGSPAAPDRRDVPEDWDRDQRAVIDLPACERVLVSAGPGMGKTAVACARVASLVAAGVEPANIWLVSFTRTAVREIRNRITALVRREDRASAVRITTLDSHAWHLAQGFDSASAKNPFRGYDQTIESVVGLLREGSDELAEYLESLEHLIVDEAQDLVGIRADLVLELIDRLPDSCGVTVFADDAQAIYGWTADDASRQSGDPEDNLPSRLRARKKRSLRLMELRTVHRTDSEGLRKIFEITRAKVLRPAKSAVAKVLEIRTDVEALADGTVGQVLQQGLSGRDDVLLLFRRRGEVLMASSFLLEAGIAHRVRMSGLPVCIAPWVAITLGDFTGRHLTRDEFDRRWADRMAAPAGTRPGLDKAWSDLVGVAGDRGGRVEIKRLRTRLGTASPPLAFCTPELGTRGPIVGTIHASKGREADVVHLMLSETSFGKDPDGEGRDSTEEEGRVIFVGATRARRSLHVGKGYPYPGKSLSASGRAYRHARKGGGTSANVEIGRSGDLDELSCVADDGEVDPATIRESQLLLREIAESITPATTSTVRMPDGKFQWRLNGMHGESQVRLGRLGHRLVSDLFEVGKDVRNWQSWWTKLMPVSPIEHLYIVGVRSVVLAPDHPDAESLAQPYAESGIFLCPVVYGFPRVRFKGYR